jgi:hypothetical protein
MAHSAVVSAFGKSAKLQASRSHRQWLKVRLTLRKPSRATAGRLSRVFDIRLSLINGTRQIMSDNRRWSVYAANGNTDSSNPNEICQNLHRPRRDYRSR